MGWDGMGWMAWDGRWMDGWGERDYEALHIISLSPPPSFPEQTNDIAQSEPHEHGSILWAMVDSCVLDRIPDSQLFFSLRSICSLTQLAHNLFPLGRPSAPSPHSLSPLRAA